VTAIHVRNVPDPVIAALRERAARKGRSMQQELLAILEAAAREAPVPDAVGPIQLRTVRVGGSGSWSREEIYDDEGR
jgi:plasmid stability protein